MKMINTSLYGAMLLCFSFTANAAVVQYQVSLDGAQLGGTGDADGYGYASLFIDDQALTIGWDFSVYNIALPLTAAHIHFAPAGSNGPVVVDFAGQLNGVGHYDADLASVLANPANYYINLHNSEYGTGAIRGQLGSPVPVPAALPLLLSGLGMLGAWGRKRLA